MAISGERDLDRARDLRKRSTDAKGGEAKRIMSLAADRLEARGARKLARLARKKRQSSTANPLPVQRR